MKTIGHGPNPQPCIILACIVLKVDFIWHLSSLLHSGLYPVSPSSSLLVIRYDTRCYFNVRSKANISQLNLPHGTDN